MAYKGPSDPKEAHPSAPNPLLQLRPGGGGDGRFTARAHRSGHRALAPFRALDSFPEPPEAEPRIPESPAPKNHQWPPGSLGSRVNAALPPPLPGPVERRRPPWPRLSCGCGARVGPLGAAALGTAPPPPRCPEPQLAGRCAVEARGGAPPASSPAGKRGAGGEAGARGGRTERCTHTHPRSRAPRSGPGKWPDRCGDSWAAAEPWRSGLGPRGGGAPGSSRGASALREDRAAGGRRGLQAPGLGRRLPSSEMSVCPSVPGPTASAAGYRGRRAACSSGCPRLEITRTTASTWSPNSLKSTSSHQPLICIPEVAPRSPAREPLRPPPPGGSPAGRGGRLAGRTWRRRGGVGGGGGGGGGWRWSLLGKRQSPGCLQIFSSATFRAPLTSAIAALPSLLAPRVRSQSYFLREPGSPDLFRGWLRSLRRPPGSPRLPS